MSRIPQHRDQSKNMLWLFNYHYLPVFELSVQHPMPFDLFLVSSFQWFWYMNCMWIWECGQSLSQRS